MSAAFFSAPAVAAWMSYVAIISCVVVFAAIAGHDAQRSSNRSLRWIWIVAIGVITALSIAAPFRNRVTASPIAGQLESFNGAPVSASMAEGNELQALIAAVRKAAIAPIQITLNRAQLAVSSAPAIVYKSIVLLWLAVSTILIAGFIFSYQRMIHHARNSRRAQISGIPVRVSPTIGPAVIGLAPSQIVVPEWLCSRPTSEQEIAVAHESEHIRAADPWLLVGACTAVALMPWNPPLWYCLSQLRLAIEIDCDRRVLRTGVPVNNYGSVLIDLSALKPRLPVVMPAFPDSHSHLERRLIAMTENPVHTKSARRIAGLIFGATVLITACDSKLPTSAEVEQMDVASAEKKIAEAGTRASTDWRYVVDGKTVDMRYAKSLKASEIGSVSVQKEEEGPGQIRIATLKQVPAGYVPSVHEKMITAGTRTRIALTEQKAKTAFNGLVIIDGVAATPSALNSISPDRILSMEVMKSSTATQKYKDPRAANGVIIVTTKN